MIIVDGSEIPRQKTTVLDGGAKTLVNNGRNYHLSTG